MRDGGRAPSSSPRPKVQAAGTGVPDRAHPSPASAKGGGLVPLSAVLLVARVDAGCGMTAAVTRRQRYAFEHPLSRADVDLAPYRVIRPYKGALLVTILAVDR